MQREYGYSKTSPGTLEMLDNTKMPKKAITGTPWYNIVANPSYSEEFAFFNAGIHEREKLIEDGRAEKFLDDGVTMTAESRMHRYEQSDMVHVLLNLAYIPDQVVRKVDFDPGWSRRFRQLMDAYKKAHEQKHRRRWSSQNMQLELEFVENMRRKAEVDQDLIEEMEGSFYFESFRKRYISEYVRPRQKEKAE